MELSAMTEPQLGGTYEELLAIARWSEENGLASFARSDHYDWRGDDTRAATDAFATLAGLARDTSTIRLAVLVSPITFRHPAVIAKTAATIDEMSGGRLDLGVGTGWMEEEHEAYSLPFWDWPERFARFEESLGYLRSAFAPGQSTFEGEFYSLNAAARPKPTGTRLIVGGTGPVRTPRLAGTYADEYNHLIHTPETIAPKIARMREAAGDRDVTVSIMGGALVGRTDAEYRERLAAEAAKHDLTPEELEARLEERGEPHGTPAQAAETVAALEEIGVSKWYVQWLDASDLDGFAATIEVLQG